MKKFLSLIIVMGLMLAFSPAAFAGDGIVKDNGHLYSCSGGQCRCYSILFQAEKEAKEIEALEVLKVWMRTERDAEGMRYDTVVAEVEQAYDKEGVDENQAFLDANEVVKEFLQGYYDEDDIAEELFRTSEFIHGQVEDKFEYIEGTSSKSSALEYRIVAADSAKKIIFSRAAIEGEINSLVVRAGDVAVQLPEDCFNKAFTLGLSFAEDGSAELMLVDETGVAIDGAELIELD